MFTLTLFSCHQINGGMHIGTVYVGLEINLLACSLTRLHVSFLLYLYAKTKAYLYIYKLPDMKQELHCIDSDLNRTERNSSKVSQFDEIEIYQRHTLFDMYVVLELMYVFQIQNVQSGVSPFDLATTTKLLDWFALVPGPLFTYGLFQLSNIYKSVSCKVPVSVYIAIF